uniref:Serpin B6 n=1 Tax=Scolopendra viridis TaxID=118503 RepID=A0A4D5R979_SCOVI
MEFFFTKTASSILLVSVILISATRGAPATSELLTYIVDGRENFDIFSGERDKYPDAIPLIALANISDANLAFTLDVHRQLANESDVTNVVFSPLSLIYALVMTYSGAQGETKNQLRELLHLGNLSDDDINRTFRGWLWSGTNNTNGSVLDIANRLYVGRNYGLNPQFSQQVQHNFNSTVRQVDFFKEGDATRKGINLWVEEKTHGKIRHLLPVPLDPSSSVVLINAIYFRGVWQFKFDPHETIKDYFFVSPTEKMPVAMMQMLNPFPYNYWPELRARMVGLPYSGARFAMFLILPDPGVQLESVENKLNVSTLRRMQRELEEVNVTLVLPRFKLEEGGSMRGVLTGLGCGDLLDPEYADLGAMTTTPRVALSDIVHKAVVEVSEEGTEAATASVAMLTRTIDPRNRLVMVNRPFLFYITDTVTGFILFWGRVVVPHS